MSPFITKAAQTLKTLLVRPFNYLFGKADDEEGGSGGGGPTPVQKSPVGVSPQGETLSNHAANNAILKVATDDLQVPLNNLVSKLIHSGLNQVNYKNNSIIGSILPATDPHFSTVEARKAKQAEQHTPSENSPNTENSQPTPNNHKNPTPRLR